MLVTIGSNLEETKYLGSLLIDLNSIRNGREFVLPSSLITKDLETKTLYCRSVGCDLSCCSGHGFNLGLGRNF